MSDDQLNRMETKLDYVYDHMLKQSDINAKDQEQLKNHLANHKIVSSVISWGIGICISLGIFKSMGG